MKIIRAIRFVWHDLTCQLSFRVKFGDGTLSSLMTHDCAMDIMDEGEEVVFDPEGKMTAQNPHNIPPSQIDHANH